MRLTERCFWFCGSSLALGKSLEKQARLYGELELDETRTGPHNLAPLDDEVAERRGQGRSKSEDLKLNDAERC